MAKTLLDFRFLLTFLAWQYGEEEFDSKTVAEDLQAILYPILKDPRLQDRLRPKLISNDLRRLYLMGFLRRKKVDRECENKRGKRYKCGYKYMYRINNQGWKYLRDYLLKLYIQKTREGISPIPSPSEVREEFEVAHLGMMKLMMLELAGSGRIPESMRLWSYTEDKIDKKFTSQGYRRFPLKRILFEERIRCWMIILDLQQKIRALQEELKAKEQRIRELEEKIKPEACE